MDCCLKMLLRKMTECKYTDFLNPRQVVTSKRVKENHIIFIPWLPLVKSWSSSLYCYLQKNLLVIFKNSSNFWFPVVEWLSEICAWSLFAILVIGPLPYQLFYYIIVLVSNCIGSSCETVIFYIWQVWREAI